MNFVVNTLLWVSVAANVCIGSAVLLRNSHSRLNKLFFSLTLAITLWASTNLLFQTSAEHRYLIALVSYASAALIGLFFFLFCRELSKNALRKKELIIVLLLGFVFAVLSAVPGLIAKGVDSQARVVTNLPMLVLYGGVLVFYFLTGFKYLIKQLRTAKGLTKSRLQIMISSLALAALFGVYCNLILPIQGIYGYTQLGPTFTLIFILGTGYSIVRHRLFDIRLVIVRSFTYFLLLLTIACVYAVLTFGIAEWIFSGAITVTQKIIYVSMAILLAMTFAPLKLLFDKLTTSIFYKGVYDTQSVINKLTALHVRIINIDKLTHLSVDILRTALTAQYVGIILGKGENEMRSVYSGSPPLYEEDLSQVLGIHKEQMVILDELEETNKLSRALLRSDCAIAVPLKTSDDFIGHIVFGFKASGGAYTTKDIDLIRIVSEELAVAVQNSLRFDEIGRFNETLQQRVAEATTQLRESNRKLKKLDEAKDEFISMASHQLRTPLTSVKGYISMALDGDMGKLTAPQQRLLEEAFGAAQRMVYLIGDFLNVSRLQTGRFVLELKRTDLAQVVNDEIAQLASTAARRNVTVTYHYPTQFPIVTIDENKIRQVVMNFIDNAIFYSRTKGVVDVTLVNTGRDITFEVRDRGIGVPKSEQHKLFTKFFRAENARHVRPDGTGVGLFMAKKVIMAHGGSILFETKENKGSTFGFVLPLMALKDKTEKLK